MQGQIDKTFDNIFYVVPANETTEFCVKFVIYLQIQFFLWRLQADLQRYIKFPKRIH